LRNIVVSLVESDGVPMVGEKKRDLEPANGKSFGGSGKGRGHGTGER
jgi:hypothetical protein